MTQQAALDTSRMNRDSEALLDQAPQFRYAKIRLILARLGNKIHNLVGQLVSLFGAAFVRNQCSKPALFERRQSLIERRSRKAESHGGTGYRLALALHSAQHLVLDLDKIPGIEKAVVGKQRVGHV